MSAMKGCDKSCPQVFLVCVCGISIFPAARMNYRETAAMSFETNFQVLSSVLISVAAGVL